MGIFSDVQLIYTEGIRGFRSKASRETNRLLLGCDALVYLGALALLVALASQQLNAIAQYAATPLNAPSPDSSRRWAVVSMCLLSLPIVAAASAYLLATTMRRNVALSITRDGTNTFAVCCANVFILECASAVLCYVASIVQHYAFATYYLTQYDLGALNGDPLSYSLYSTFSMSYSGLASYFGIGGVYPRASLGAALVNELLAHLFQWILGTTYFLFLLRGFLFAESASAMRATLVKMFLVAPPVSYAILTAWLQIDDAWKTAPPALDYFHLVLFLLSTAALLAMIRVFRRHFQPAPDPAVQSNP